MTPAVIRDQALFSGFSVLEFDQPAGMRVPLHFHEATTLFCVVDGEAVDRLGRRTFSMAAGSVLLRPAGATHTHEYPAPLHAIAVSIETTAIERVDVPQRPAVSSASPLVRSLLDELHIADAVRPLGVSAAVAEIVAHLTARGSDRVRGGIPEWLARIRELLHDQCGSRISLAELGEVAGMHPGHLARAFRTHFGTSIAAYSRQLRLRRAARALMRSDATIADIALQYGFCDQSHFDRLFGRSFGSTPSSFRSMFGSSKPGRTNADTMAR